MQLLVLGIDFSKCNHIGVVGVLATSTVYFRNFSQNVIKPT
jgi:hypothetical protein